MMILALLIPFTTTDVSADEVGPQITDIFHVPNYPLYGENVTVFATVTDPDGIQLVRIQYCVSSCSLVIMDGPDSNDMFWGTIPWDPAWENGTVAYYDIYAKDNNSNTTTSKKIYFFFASEIELGTESDDSIFLGETLTLRGSALYDGNDTAYVVNSNVTVKIIETGRELYTTTDSMGNFSLGIPFSTPGDYTIHTTVSNRTLVAYDEVSVTVIGITYLSQDMQMTTCYPGQDIWVNGTARYSTGNAVANSDIKVRINETLFWTAKTDSSGNYSILITVPSELGGYNVNVTVGNGSLEAYSEKVISVTEIPLPDLVVDGEDIIFTATNDPPLPDDSVSITAVVQNLGSANCTDVTVHFYFGHPSGGDLIGSDTIPSIPVGDIDTASVLWNAVEGTHDIRVVVDPMNSTDESIESNNNASSSIFVDEDLDDDGVGNLADSDDDGDGADDDDDAFPNDPAASIDTDGDGMPDDWNEGKTSLDSTTGLTVDSDDDDDGVDDTEDAFPVDDSEWLDTDEDGKGNNVDTDDDGDGLTDVVERNMETDPLKSDTDGDGVNDLDDYDPLDPKVKEEPSDQSLLIFLIVIIVIVVALIAVLFIMFKMKKGK